MNHRKYPRAALPAFALFLFAAVAMLVSPAASGQKGNRVAEEIGQALKSFETVTLDPVDVLRQVREGGSVTLQTARGAFDLVVEPYDVRSDDYRAYATGADGVLTELPRTPSNSWRGKVRGQADTTVRLYLDGQKVQGIIITPSETFYVEPARDISSAAASGQAVFYASSDVLPTDASCEEVTLGGKVAAEAARAGAKSAAAITTPRPDDLFAPKPVARIAAEADFEFYQQNGNSRTATENDIASIMTQVDGIYDAGLGIRINLVSTHVWETSNDPYTTNNASDALEEFAAKYDGTFGTSNPPSRELTHMFTGKDFDGTTIGVAYPSVVCIAPDFSYGISQSRFSNINSRRVTVTAHEIGHNFGATHTDGEKSPPSDLSGCNPSIMNSSVQNQTTPTFCQFSRDQITSHVAGAGGACLTRLTQAGCTYALNPALQLFSSNGGAGSAFIQTSTSCPWGVAEGADWISPNVSAGSGSTTIFYNVAANTNSGPRQTIVDIGGQKLTVKQAAAPGCSGTRISVGQTFAASLTDSDCRSGQTGHINAPADIYTFTGRANQRVRIEMLAAVKASNYDNLPPDQDPPDEALDTYLYVYGPGGTIIATNDDISPRPQHNTDSAVTISGLLTLPATGVYTVIATSFDDYDNGDYTFRLRDNSAASTVSFSSAAYTVDEGTGGGGLGSDGNGFRVVTVTRTGDTTGTATVDYATSDGTASKQKDYTQTLGTLVFAPGEASKTFTVFVDDDAFQEGAETVTLTLSNVVGTTLGATQTATLTINSNDSANGPSPVRAQSFNTAFSVRQQYLDFLSREPDASGFNFWQGEINGCGADEQCKEVKRINVSAAFFLSIEFQETGYFVYRMYKVAYGDATSPNVAGTVPVIRLNEFLPDTQRIGQGVIVGPTGWEQLLEANKQAYALEFVLRPRFLAAYPLSMTPEQYVDKLSLNVGAAPTPADRDMLLANFTATGDVSAARVAVLRSLVETPIVRLGEFRRAFVLMQYYGYLRRNPDDAPERDLNFGGWKFWLDKLNENGGNYVQAEMVKAFLTSDEYIDRFGTRP